MLAVPAANSEENYNIRIIGGYTATGAWPFMVALIEWNPNTKTYSFHCGASLISSEHVMTAAHCVDGISAQNLFVIIGDSTPTDLGWEDQKIAISFVKTHEEYNRVEFDNDIAVLTLEFPVASTPIAVTQAEATKSFSSILPYSALGWGDTDARDSCSSYPVSLQKVELNIVDETNCLSSYGTLLTENMICATAADTSTYNKDSCQGDSGGPLIEHLGDGQYQQVGITSWGSSCGDPENPGVYTDVSEYYNWISDITINAPQSFKVETSRAVRGPSSASSCEKSGGSLDLLFLLISLFFIKGRFRASQVY